MLEKLSHKRRFFLVVLVFIVLLFAIYKKTYRPIFELKSELNASYQLAENAEQPFEEIQNLKAELSVLDNVVGNSENHALLQQKILHFVTTQPFQVSVATIEDTHVHKGNAFTVFTNKIVLKGKYNALLKAMYTIEKEFKASKIVSSKFYNKKNYRTNTSELFLELYFQNYGK
jgi:hypothetical protein